jgi:hypothetical protein
MLPGVEVFGAPATGGAIVAGGTLEPVVGLVGGGRMPESGETVPSALPGEVPSGEVGLGVAPRPEPAGPLVPPAVCACAGPVSASRIAVMAM